MNQSIDDKKQEIREELENLRYEFKVDLPKKIAQARSYGDLKENADYHAARERQGFVKARIAQLNAQLSQLNSININNAEGNKIGFGSTVTVIDLDTNEKIEFTFVHPNEVNPLEGKISASSPIGAALNNRSAGEEVEAVIPAGKKRYYIEKIISLQGTEYTV